MAVTRREFITTLGMLATAVGIGEADLAKVTEAFAHGGAWGGTDGPYKGTKPKVIWLHGAECTGCSTSLLSLFEDAQGVAVPGTGLGDIATGQALGFIASGHYPTANAPTPSVGLVPNIVTSLTSGADGGSHRRLETVYQDGGTAYSVNIADVLIDFIDLQYHETVMGMGGDAAYHFLDNEMHHYTETPFVMVCEGAAQLTDNKGYWGAAKGDGNLPWCSIAKDGSQGTGTKTELAFADVVSTLALRSECVAIVAIGQCASFGGYPACSGPGLVAQGTASKSMTGALGIFDFLEKHYDTPDPAGIYPKNKVINVPGCPANPWWFTLTVVAWMVDAVYVTASGGLTGGHYAAAGVLGVLNDDLTINAGSVDGSQRRLLAVYGSLLHSKYCPRYQDFANNVFAAAPGDPGCLKNLGCKGIYTMTSCGRHGWNNAQPQNAVPGAMNAGTLRIDAAGVVTGTPVVGSQKVPLYTHTGADGTVTDIGSFCITSGHPCMGCTEQGYPDSMTPFVKI